MFLSPWDDRWEICRPVGKVCEEALIYKALWWHDEAPEDKKSIRKLHE